MAVVWVFLTNLYRLSQPVSVFGVLWTQASWLDEVFHELWVLPCCKISGGFFTLHFSCNTQQFGRGASDE
jgi:hypothetical protein